ncbi:MAG TPA: hypothetical protein VJ739_17305 [Gemmataceae bacterium]|nr:hypothetical protein [Gemmataceae bacterium]
MTANVKRQAARVALRWQLPALLRHPGRLNALLGQAVRLQLGRIGEEEFRRQLDDFYGGLERDGLMEEIEFERRVKELDRPGGYKSRITRLREDAAGDGRNAPGPFWGRRFALLHHLGVRLDVLALPRGEQIPPHGHYRVVSGFYVLGGEVAVRHYDRVREEGQVLLVRQALDAVLAPGGYTTNSEYHHNIHWLYGLSPRSYLFRVTVSGTPTTTFGSAGRTDERVYVDPTAAPDAEGLIAARYVSEAEAAGLPFAPVPAAR